MRIVFKDEAFGEVKEISIIIVINNRVLTRKMVRAGNCWLIDMDIPDGEHMYKYVINESPVSYKDKHSSTISLHQDLLHQRQCQRKRKRHHRQLTYKHKPRRH